MIERTNASISSCPPVCMMCTGPSACPAMVALLGFTSYRSHPTSNGNPISLSLSVSLSLSHNQHKEKSNGAILPPRPPRAPRPSTDNSRDNENKQTKREEEPGEENQTKERTSRRAVPTGGQPLARLSTHHWEGSKRKTKNLHRSPKKTETNQPNFALRAVGRLSSSNKKKKEKVVTKDRPQKKEKKNSAAHKSKSDKTQNTTNKQKNHKVEEEAK